MGPNLESEFASMMAASFGGHWASDLPSRQIAAMRQAFFGGAVSVLSQIPIDPRVNAPRDPLEPLRQQCAEFLRAHNQQHGLN